MASLVIAKHDNASLKDATHKTVTAAAQVSSPVHVLVAGENCEGVAEAAAKIAGVEKVFQDAGGRPHWAKRHTLTSADVLRLYPDAPKFGAVRKRVDPAGKFLNAHLSQLFEFSL